MEGSPLAFACIRARRHIYTSVISITRTRAAAKFSYARTEPVFARITSALYITSFAVLGNNRRSRRVHWLAYFSPSPRLSLSVYLHSFQIQSSQADYRARVRLPISQLFLRKFNKIYMFLYLRDLILYLLLLFFFFFNNFSLLSRVTLCTC